MIERTAGRILRGLCAIMLAGVAVDVAQAGETAGIPPESGGRVHSCDHSSRSDHLFHPCRGAAAGSQGHCGGGRMESERDVASSGSNATDGWSRDSGARTRASYPVGQPGPIYKKTGLRIQFERAGLEAVAKNPRKPYTGIMTEGDRHYFKRYLRTGPSP